ncbi:MAG TPA: hypothetical protein PKN66_06140 [Thermodesulfovibrio thiophilus]|nr:hypothetical protein [Thermodesulfovibrio thiophilus]
MKVLGLKEIKTDNNIKEAIPCRTKKRNNVTALSMLKKITKPAISDIKDI